MVNSQYRKKEVKVKYMFGFDISVDTIEYPREEQYNEKIDNKEKKYGRSRKRWVIRMNKDYCIWQWASNEKGRSLGDSEVFKIYKEMIKSLEKSVTSTKKNIFLVEDIPNDNRLIPVIYQPAIDSWKNFVREIHCYKINENEYEVTILFENEQLRKHDKLDIFYRIFRLFRYKRVTDIESFRIILDKGIPIKLQFKGIFSCEHTIEDDNIHGDKTPDGKAPIHDIKYYFNNEMHPIIFINTSNHAMSFHDTNHKLWKWEYIPWEKDSAVIYGQKSRSNVDRFSWPKNNYNK